MDFNIDPLHLFFPDMLPEDGKAFMKAHGIEDLSLEELTKDSVALPDGNILIRHRCKKLTNKGLCSIYEDRPKICRDFDCSTRSDCACKGRGKI